MLLLKGKTLPCALRDAKKLALLKGLSLSADDGRDKVDTSEYLCPCVGVNPVEVEADKGESTTPGETGKACSEGEGE